MDWTALIAAHGYWVLAVGCLLEGESVLILAGYAAHRGLLHPVSVVAIAATAGFLGDQAFFWLGRRHGQALVARWPAVGRQSDRLVKLTRRFADAAVIGVRFAYGLRVAGPILMGMSPMSGLRFATLNAAGALIWAVLVGGVGWVFGQAAEMVLGRLQHYEGWLIAGLVAGIALVAGVRRWRAAHP